MVAKLKILVVGAGGQLGSEFRLLSDKCEQHTFTFLQREELDLLNYAAVGDFLVCGRYDVVINCSAYTAVDGAESEQEAADQVNHLAVKNLAEAAKRAGSALVHVSTDYVYGGEANEPYVETDAVEPKSVYGRTKLAGENAVLATCVNSVILRTGWLYSSCGNNFLKTMLKLGRERDELGVIYDQIGTPTYARDLALVIVEILEDGGLLSSDFGSRIYNYGNEGVASWYDFSKAIFEDADIACKVYPITTDQYPTPAERPKFSVLNKKKIKDEFAVTIPYWRDSLCDCIRVLSEAHK